MILKAGYRFKCGDKSAIIGLFIKDSLSEDWYGITAGHAIDVDQVAKSTVDDEIIGICVYSLHESKCTKLGEMDFALIKIQTDLVEKPPKIMLRREMKHQLGSCGDDEVVYVLNTDLFDKEFEVRLDHEHCAIRLRRENQDKYNIQPGDSGSLVFDYVDRKTIQLYGMITHALIDEENFNPPENYARETVASIGVAIHIKTIKKHLEGKGFNLDWKGDYMHLRMEMEETTAVGENLPLTVIENDVD